MRTTIHGLSTALSLALFSALSAAQQDGSASIVTVDPRVRLQYATFDPLAELPQVPAALHSAQDVHLWIVQFHQAPLDRDRDLVRATGAAIAGFLPTHCHLVRMDAAMVPAVSRIPAVRWVGAYEPAYRLERFLRLEQQAGGPVPTRRYNMVMTDKRADKRALERKLVQLGGVVFDRHIDSLLFTADLTGPQLLAAARLDEVLWIDRWSAPENDMNNARIQGGANTIETAGGYTGSGIRGHIYEGCEFNHPDFTPAMTNVLSGGQAQRHGHCTTGIVFGDGTSSANARGMAPDAVGFYTNYTTVTAGNSRNMVINTVVNTHNCMFTTASWGNAQTNLYTADSADADDIVFDHRIPWTQSMSNLGNQNARPQAWAKNVISIGGVQHFDNSSAADDSWLAGNGSIGPAQDGRNKPDLAAYYDSVWTSDLSSGTNNGEGTAAIGGYNTAADPAGQSTSGFNGTSSATPIVAGHNALAIQMYTDHIFNTAPRVQGGTRFQNRPYAQTLKALMISGASLYTPTATDNRREHVGWGFPGLQNLYNRSDRFTIIPEDAPITQGATHSYQINVLSGETTLKVCMTYLDPAGNPASAIDRINDLTLRVIAPNGTTSYWGNVGLVGAAQTNNSTTGGSANTLDTVECVMLTNPTAGTWTIEVTAPVIAQDANLATPATDATYALVVNGGRRLFGSGCARYVPDTSTTASGGGNYFPFGGYAPATLTSLFATNNGGAIGGTVYFNVTVTSPLYLTGLALNTNTTAGTPIFLDVYRTAAGSTHVGNELNPAAWTALTAGSGVAAGVDVASAVEFAQPFFLPAGTYGIAIVASNFGHSYTNGNGSNQNYSSAAIDIAAGSATNGAFGPSAITPRVANVTLQYRIDNAQGTNLRYQTIVRRADLGVAGTLRSLSFSSLVTGRHWNESLLVRLSHVPAGHTLSSTFATNLPTPVTVLNASNFSFGMNADNWTDLGLQTPFSYNGTSDLVIDIVTRGNWQPVTGTFHTSDEDRVFATSWSGATPTTGTVGTSSALRMRLGYNCGTANDHGASCGRLVASHTGNGNRPSTFQFRVAGAPNNFIAIISLGLSNAAPLPISLTSFGWTNCLGFNDPVTLPSVNTDASGNGVYPLSIPNNPALDGAFVFGQWFTLDSSEPGDLTFSGHTRVLVGQLP